MFYAKKDLFCDPKTSQKADTQSSKPRVHCPEEYESCQDRTGGPVVRGQSSPSFVRSVIKTNIPLNDDPAHKEFVLQRYRERIEKL